MSKLSKRDFVCLLVFALGIGQFTGFGIAALLGLGINDWPLVGFLFAAELMVTLTLLDRYLPKPARPVDLPPLPTRGETVRRIWSRQARFRHAGKSMLDNMRGSS